MSEMKLHGFTFRHGGVMVVEVHATTVNLIYVHGEVELGLSLDKGEFERFVGFLNKTVEAIKGRA